ncbi:MAG: hypothetical protein N2260_05450 [Syntrophobacterales bacterium]|nr:hypothetical protein [Syntrophobacterales bacterium]
MERKFLYHLCQPDNRKSCAACCGIYNFRRNSREDIAKRLRKNTAHITGLADQGLKEEDLEAYSSEIRALYNGSDKLCLTVFNCEFVGFLDKDENRVGCLLHPTKNNGRDWRSCSFYGEELCEGHYCLSYFYLTVEEQRLVIETIDDWYLYGLTITDIDLVKGVFSAISDILGESLNPSIVSKNSILRRILNQIWQMKLSWRYRVRDENSFGKYIFKGEDYREVRIPYESFGRRTSPYHRIFLSFGSEFRDVDELESAERMLSRVFDLFAKTYSKVPLAESNDSRRRPE